MNTKLTLSLNKDIILQAKNYAQQHNVSLSFLVENYFLKLLTEIPEKPVFKGSIVQELSGIINLDASTDYKEELTHHFNKKYQ